MADTSKKYLDLTGLSTFWSQIKTGYIDVNAKAIADEITRAKAAEKLNADNLAQEIADRAAADSALETAYKAADSALETAYKAADSALETAYKAADATLKSDLEGQIGAEKTARENADSAIRTDFAAADSALQSAIDAEKTARENADSALQDAIDAVDEKVDNMSTGKISEIEGKVNTLIGSDANMSARDIVVDEVAKQLKDDNISESFDTLKEMAEYLSGHPQDVTEMNAAIKANQEAIAKEAQDRTAADSALQEAINAEAERATGVESAIRSEFAAADTAIRTDFAAADTAIRTDFAAADEELATEISTKVDQTAYEAKVQALEAADSALDTRVKALEDDTTNADAIKAEESARKAQDDKIEAAIGLAADGSHVTTTGNYTSEATTVVGEIAALDAQVKVNADGLAAEITRAKAAEAKALTDAKAYADEKDAALKTNLEGQITALDTAYKAADSTLEGKITDEATARAEAVEDLEGQISTEKSARENADTTLQNNINAEATARENADTALSNRISSLETFASTDYVTETEWEARAIAEADILALFTE